MQKDGRARVAGGINRAGESTETSAKPRLRGALTIGELARETGVTLRALRFYQSKGLLAPQRKGSTRIYTREDRDALLLILQGKRLGFTLTEIRDMLAARANGGAGTLPVSRKKCIEQINMLERQRRDIDRALLELRRIYTEMFLASRGRRAAGGSGG